MYLLALYTSIIKRRNLRVLEYSSQVEVSVVKHWKRLERSNSTVKDRVLVEFVFEYNTIAGTCYKIRLLWKTGFY